MNGSVGNVPFKVMNNEIMGQHLFTPPPPLSGRIFLESHLVLATWDIRWREIESGQAGRKKMPSLCP